MNRLDLYKVKCNNGIEVIIEDDYDEQGYLIRRTLRGWQEITNSEDITDEVLDTGLIHAVSKPTEPGIYTVYSQEYDISFIFRESETTTELCGWYYGEPDDKATECFIDETSYDYPVEM